jgi:hypothetical protein
MNIKELRARAAKLMRGALKHAGTAALAAALVPLGAVGANALQIVHPIDSSVTPNGANFDYAFTIHNVNTFSGGNIKNMMLPLFSASDVSNVVEPTGWTDQIIDPAAAGWKYSTSNDAALSGNPLKYGPNPQVFNNPPLVLSFSTSGPGIPEFGGSLSGFGFTSAYPAAAAPFTLHYAFGATDIVDPPSPDSPARIAAQLPEPSTLVLFVTAGAGLAGAAWRRRRRTDG